jgi:hypothetical protein
MINGDYTYTTIAAATGDEAGHAAATALRLMGYSIRETAGAAATVSIEHGTANSAPIMGDETLAANGCVNRWFGPQGLPCASGIWVERAGGTTKVNLVTTKG